MTWDHPEIAIGRTRSKEWGIMDACKDWCDIDRLHGNALVDGEKLEVMWPDGTTEAVKVHLVDHSYAVNDMGSMYNVPVLKAHADTLYHGARALIPLHGLNVRRI